MRLSTLLSCAGLCSVVLLGSPAIGEDDAPRETPAGTAFTYQGLLKSSGAEVNEAVDIRIRLYDAAIDGNQIGAEQEILGVSVVDGVFSVELDFGAQFNGNRRWVEIDVKLSSSPDPYETLAPRQEVTPSPFALFSLSTGIIPDAALTGTYTQQIDLTNTSNTIAGDGGGLTNLAASSIGDGTINSILSLTNANNTFVGDGTGLENLNWAALIGVPAGFADGIDNAGGVWNENGNDAYFNTGNVGIGTSDPDGRLHVEGHTITENLTIGSSSANPTDFFLRSTSAGTDDAPALISVNQWNVGAPLTEGLRLANRNLSGAVGLGLLGGADNVTDLPGVYLGTVGGSNQNDFRISTNEAGTMRDRVYVDGDSGNVGIGTTNPLSNLHIAPQSGSASLAMIGAGEPEGISFAVGGDGLAIGKRDSDGSNFQYLGRLTFDGNLGIGTSNPAVRLHVRGDTSWPLRIDGPSNPGLRIEADGAGSSWAIYHNSSDDNLTFRDSTTGATRMAIRGDSGDVGIGTTTPQAALSVTKVNPQIVPTTLGVHVGMIPYANNSAAAVTLAGGSEGSQLRFVEIGGDSGDARLWYNPGTNNLTFDGGGLSKVSLPVLEIRGGADIVEGFDTSCGTELEPGTVVVIDPDTPGALMASAEAYDFKVAGVVSGANGVSAGMHLGQDGVLDGDTKVAMTGRVYVKCSAENGAIRPGDRLTTAALAGHAMKATDGARSDGAVIGKAMSSLDEGTGLVLVLVNLQ